MNRRRVRLKTILWALMGVLAVVTVARFTRGLGATTDLSDATPWGFWIAFDVMAGVALAAGGFVLAATVYIFGRETYRPFVRPAILTAFLGYVAVAVGLTYDLGLPWHIWHPILYPQHHSVLFEVAMCVMLYLTVLTLEFAPAVLEHPRLDRPMLRGLHRLLKKGVIPLVIAGIVLSTLHQSSLGSLFLITPYRLHPLWYSPIIWILFLVSAIALGLMMVTAESFFSAWLFGHRPRLDLLERLGRAASAVLWIYLALRLGDLSARGLLGAMFDGSWQSALFLFEVSLSALLPAVLLLLGRVRRSAAGLGVCAAMVIMGMIGYRFDVCVVAFARPQGMSYFPSWMELAVSLGIVAGAMLVFIFFVERLKVYPPRHARRAADDGRDCNPAATRPLLVDSVAGPRRYSLAVVLAAALTIALLPDSVLSSRQAEPTPVSSPRTLEGWMRPRTGEPGHELRIAWPGTTPPAGARRVPLQMIDGNRDGRLVLFPHKLHVAELGGEGSCVQCHHQNLPFDRNSSCSQCHRDMYGLTDIFDHSRHVGWLGGNEGCVRCHADSAQAKSRRTALACGECHGEMMVAGSIIEPPAEGMTGLAPGYMAAMHGLCIDCHERKVKASPDAFAPAFAECANCHRDVDAARFRRAAPYAISRSEK